jgi:hypothetical protein
MGAAGKNTARAVPFPPSLVFFCFGVCYVFVFTSGLMLMQAVNIILIIYPSTKLLYVAMLQRVALRATFLGVNTTRRGALSGL